MLDILLTSLICGLLAFVIGWALLNALVYVLAWTWKGLCVLWDGMGKVIARNHHNGHGHGR